MAASLLDFMPLIAVQCLSPQRLDRTPEPESVMEQTESVQQYNRVMQTQLSIAYAVALETIYRAATDPRKIRSAIDVACGTGHFTLCLTQQLGLERVTGIDLSSPMVETARDNAKNLNLPIQFEVGDATRLEGIGDGEFDLASFNNAAHHMPAMDTVRNVIAELERVTRPDGLIIILDLARLRTRRQTEKYVSLIGQDYVERGLPDFFNDFRNSMFAAWSIAELRTAVPESTQRWWYQLAPVGLPSTQILLGLPAGRKQIFVRRGFPWQEDACPVPADLRAQWRLLRRLLALGRKSRIR